MRTRGAGSSRKSCPRSSNCPTQSRKQDNSGESELFLIACVLILLQSLRDGRSIRTVSALLMQLVQTSAHDVRVEAESLRDARLQALALRRQESTNEVKAAFLDEKDMEELRLYTTGLDSATKAAKTIIAFLTQRSVLSIPRVELLSDQNTKDLAKPRQRRIPTRPNTGRSSTT